MQELLYSRFAPKMYGVCLRYAGNTEDADDIIQEGFIKIFKNIGKFRNEGSFEGWVRRIFVNTSIEHFRKKIKLYNVTEVQENTNQAWITGLTHDIPTIGQVLREQAPDEVEEHALEITHAHALIDDERLELAEHRRVRGVVVTTIHDPGRDDAHGRRVRQHRADLHRGGVRAQDLRLVLAFMPFEVEGVLHRSCRVEFGHVERREVVPLILDLRPFGDGEA